MKYLKTYENENKEYWILVNIPQTGVGDATTELYDDMQSAQNAFIVLVNNLAKDDAYSNYKYQGAKYNEYDNYIFTVEEAENYASENTYNVYYTKIYNQGKFELPEELKIGKAKRGYNL